MSVTALQISINGKQLYTVGIDEWQTIWAHVLGHRFDPREFDSDPSVEDSGLPDAPVSTVSLRASVSVPTPVSERIIDSDGTTHNVSKTGSYKEVTLAVGDVVQIRVVQTDLADAPEWQERDPRFRNRPVIRRKSGPESDV